MFSFGLNYSFFTFFLVPEETETTLDQQKIETRNAFSSPEGRTTGADTGSMFGRPSMKQEYLSQCLLLGPENLEKLFDNKQIVENSQTLFLNTGYFTSQLNISNLESNSSISVNSKKRRNLENVVEDLNSAKSDHKVTALLEELYSFMEQENMLNSKVPSKLKVSILKCLYKFVESKNEYILINIAKIILSVSLGQLINFSLNHSVHTFDISADCNVIHLFISFCVVILALKWSSLFRLD